ncbi:MAG: glucosaminidase domain-containing protein [Bacilli bacterium]|nr:glucosaminidase domain-containing protein [Bacilli bacterium]
MRKMRLICLFTSFVGILMISMGLVIQEDMNRTSKAVKTVSGLDMKNMAASTNMIVKEVETPQEEVKEEDNLILTEVEMETAPASIIEPPRVEVYEGLTLEELADKLNRNLGTDTVAGQGELIASECLNKGVDPYITVAIILHETGCGTKCSNLARYCYNFGGQKGKPSCNGGAFRQFDTVEEGLVGMIDNLSRNYFAIGLNTPETIGPKYCEGDEWAGHITWFVNKIRNS